MKRKDVVAAITGWLLFSLAACNLFISDKEDGIATDTTVIAKGTAIFNAQCSGCHNFRQDAIGPQLNGITKRVSLQWLHSFILNPQQAIDAGDKRADSLYKKYKVAMPSFAALTEDELRQLIAFLNAHQQTVLYTEDDGKSLANPIPAPIKLSSLLVQLKQVAQMPPSSDSNRQLLTRITKLDYQPSTGDLFVLDLRGKLYRLQNSKPMVYLDMAKLRPEFINQPGLATGFGSFAFHPQFAKNGLLYTTHTEAARTAKADFTYADTIPVAMQWVLTEWKAAHPGAAVFWGTSRELLRVNMVSGIHGVQEIGFNPLAKQGDEEYGLLYVGVGEGGAAENGYPFLEHSRQKIWGTLLRIDPAGNNSSNGKYGIPATNPFTAGKAAGTVKEIYAYGFRNPHRFSWTKEGQLLLANVGHGNIESLYAVTKGADYGWPVREGSFLVNPFGNLNKVYPLPANDTVFRIAYPVAEYDHDEGKAISGGFEYKGKITALQGNYLFGDIPTGRLWYINVADIQQGKQAVIKEWKIAVNGTVTTLAALCGNNRVDLHFGQDGAGELYILTKPDGKIYKLIAADK